MLHKISLLFFVIGLACIAMACADIISIVVSIVEWLFHTELHAVFFSSFLFRAALLIVGCGFEFGGVWLYWRSKENAVK